MKIYPSLISSDLLNLKSTLVLLNHHCDGYHLDVMDDHFVPNLTWGPAFVNAIAQGTILPINVHLMVDNPEHWVNRFKLGEKDSFVFHWEAVPNADQVKSLVRKVRAQKMQVGIAVNPKTSVESLKDLLSDVDQILLMSVNPGFSGQKFIDVSEKIRTLINFRTTNHLSFQIGMDGGINHNNIKVLASLGVDFVGVASAIFSADDAVKALKDLYHECQ